MNVAPSDLSAAYERDGFVTRVDAFSEAEITAFRAQFDELEAREGKENCQIGPLNCRCQVVLGGKLQVFNNESVHIWIEEANVGTHCE